MRQSDILTATEAIEQMRERYEIAVDAHLKNIIASKRRCMNIFSKEYISSLERLEGYEAKLREAIEVRALEYINANSI